MRSIIFFAAIAPTILADECSPLHYVYARATTEPPQTDWASEGAMAKFDSLANAGWSKGYGAAGASLFNNLTAAIPGTTGYPVHYPASTGNSMPVGNTDMIAHLEKQSKECPSQKFVLGGHSQGGMVTVSVIPKLSKDILSKVVAVTMFGAPKCPEVVKDRCNSYCNKGDFVCDRDASAKGAKGMGGLPKSGGMPKGPQGSTRSVERRTAQADDCQYEDKHVSKGPQNAHLAYNSDGYYISKATCFIVSQFKKSQGA